MTVMIHSCEDQFCVFLGNQLVGRLHRRDEVTRFVFEDGYWDNPNRKVLGLQFEENPKARHRSHMRLPAWFSNLLPEGRLREWVAQARGASIQREMELLAQVGHDLPGAVRVVEAETIQMVDTAGADESLTESNASAKLWTFSLAGVALKFSMLAHGDRLTIPATGDNGDWIVKLPDPTHRHVPLNEFAMMTLAKTVGIDVPDIRLVHRDLIDPLPAQAWMSDESFAYAIRRFDRGPSGERIHIEDMAQVRGFYPEQKYSGSFETIGALIYRGHNTTDLREFARRIAFNALIGNGDAHLKNWSLIYRNPYAPTLAPAYDLVATFLYRPSIEGPEDMALRFGRNKRFSGVSLSSFIELEKKLNTKADLADVANDVAKGVIKELPHIEGILASVPDIAREIRFFINSGANRILR